MSIEQICYDEPDSCYSCSCNHEDHNFIVCDKNCKFKAKLMFNNLNELEMEIEYRRAVIRAKNCISYSKRRTLIS